MFTLLGLAEVALPCTLDDTSVRSKAPQAAPNWPRLAPWRRNKLSTRDEKVQNGLGAFRVLINLPHGRQKWRRACQTLLLGIPLLSGCTVGPRFHTPRVTVPARYASAPQDAPPAWPSSTWWRGFGSPALNSLIQEAEQHNFTIRIAVAQLQAANAQVEVVGAPLLPTLGANVSGQWQRAPRSNPPTPTSHQFGAAIQTSYELDFWGKNRDSLRAAEANAAASRFNRDTIALTAVSAVATTWFQILADRNALRIGLRNLAVAENLLTQLKAELNAGTTDAVTVAQQAALVASERATIPTLRSQLQQETLGLGILVGKPPELLAAPSGDIAALTVPKIVPGLPAHLLRRRPDIARAEANLVAANANVRGAIASFFPNINLTGSAGWSSAALNTLLAPGSLLLSAAAAIDQPLFEGGALTGNLAVSRATYRENVAVYEQTVVQAFTDVDTALVDLHYATEQQRRAAEAVNEARAALAAVRAQLAAGIIDVSAVLIAEETLLTDENSYTQAQLARLDAAVDLYKALGGGWHAPSPSPLSGN
ncbi:MAG TPA: efflux transporter outer membrane subunit [Acidiferrobacter sp.]|nr:efflux transporter outer membrane subunit [Acidiferrobacter sp.]